MLTTHETSVAPRTREGGVAMIAAIALLVLALAVIIGITVSTRSSLDSARSQQHGGEADALAHDAASALAASWNAMQSGEHDGYVLTKAMLQDHAEQIGGDVVANASLPAAYRTVDSRVPSSAAYTVTQPLGSGLTGYWQVYSVKLPTYGVTKGGRVLVYVRTWTGNGATMNRPTMHRLEFRPTWFADYQMLVDGRIRFGTDARISGRVHSNGFDSSWYDQYRSLGSQISLDSGASCTSTGSISTADGSIGGAGRGGCSASQRHEETGRQFNLLRARQAIDVIRDLYAAGASAHPSITIVRSTSATTNVVLSGANVRVNGNSYAATVTGDVPGDRQGVVVLASGDVTISGFLSGGARALVIASAPEGASASPSAGPPSVYVKGSFGSAPGATSSVGVIADGNIYFDEFELGSVTARAALLSISGMLSSNQRYRGPIFTGYGKVSGTVRVEGSITGHYAPLLYAPANKSGFGTREYAWNPSLFDDPPPMFPTAADWETTKIEVANLDCFDSAGRLEATTGDCG